MPGNRKYWFSVNFISFKSVNFINQCLPLIHKCIKDTNIYLFGEIQHQIKYPAV